jgi:hypothetical protein
MKKKIIQCARCGVSIEINNKQGRKKYCDRCRDIEKLEHEEAWRQKKLQAEPNYFKDLAAKSYAKRRTGGHYYTCSECQKEFFTNNSGKTKICLKCLIERSKKSSIDRLRVERRKEFYEI